MNGHEDAAADAAIVSRAVGRPVRVQWSRQDEHGWDPKGPPQLLDISGAIDPTGRILAWRTEMWLPQTTRGLPDIPLLGPAAAWPMFTTSTARVMWRWEWRLRSSEEAAVSESNGLLARTIVDRSSIPMGYARRSKAASCKRSAVC